MTLKPGADAIIPTNLVPKPLEGLEPQQALVVRKIVETSEMSVKTIVPE